MVLWLLLGGVVGLIGWLALDACGIGWADDRPLLQFCAQPTDPDPRSGALDAEQARERDLRARLDQLQLILLAQPWCEAPPPPEPPPEPPQAAAPPEPPPEPPVDIPDQAWRDRDLGVMEGCWRLISDYRIYRGDTMDFRTITDWQMCFDDSGFGSQQMVMDDGTVCSMGVHAQFLPDGRVRLADPTDTLCSDGTLLIQRTEIDCTRLADGTAQCNYIRPRRGWPVEIALSRLR